MADTPHADVAFAGYRLRRKITLALTLCSFLPLLVLAYVGYGAVLPDVNAVARMRLAGVSALLLFTALGAGAGAYILWDIGRGVARMSELLQRDVRLTDLHQRSDEVGTLTRTVTHLLETMERQAGEIGRFAGRLDAAYKELETANVRLKEVSFRDDLTGLYNRRFFMLRLEEELQRHRRFGHPASVVFVDLDGFKEINDALGHAAGDETLRDVAQLLLRQSRGINVVARHGGDEFAVLLIETSRSGARFYAERIRGLIAEYPFSHRRRVTASFGIASLPEDGLFTSEELLRAADEALYAAKRGGKDSVVDTAPERVG